jgi:hypothetical protein
MTQRPTGGRQVRPGVLAKQEAAQQVARSAVLRLPKPARRAAVSALIGPGTNLAGSKGPGTS